MCLTIVPFTSELTRLDNAAFLTKMAACASMANPLSHEHAVEAVSDPFHLAKAVRNAATNAIIRTPYGAWSMYHGHIVRSTNSALLPGWRVDDGRPIDKHDGKAVIRVAKAVRGDTAAELSTKFIVATIEVSRIGFIGRLLSAT